MMHKRAHHFSLLELDFNQHSNQLTANIFPTAKHSPQITVSLYIFQLEIPHQNI